MVPRIFTAGEWKEVSTGVAQRVRALEAFLSDVYGAARIVSDGLIPHEVITSSPGFVRAAFGLAPPNGVRIHVAGIDIMHDEEGEFRVLGSIGGTGRHRGGGVASAGRFAYGCRYTLRSPRLMPQAIHASVARR